MFFTVIKMIFLNGSILTGVVDNEGRFIAKHEH